MKNLLKNIFIGIVILYFIISTFIFAPYYNWNYAKTNGFAKWLCFGEVVSTVKSYIWPYYVFFSVPDKRYESPDYKHYSNSKKALYEAAIIINQAEDISKIPQDLKIKCADLLNLAINEANQIQLSYLQNIHPEFPDIYKNKHIYGMRLLLKGVETGNISLADSAAKEFNEFADWYEVHQSEISK